MTSGGSDGLLPSSGGVLRHQGCIHGDEKKLVGVSLRKSGRRLDWNTASPKLCLDACPEGTRAVAIKNRFVSSLVCSSLNGDHPGFWIPLLWMNQALI